MPDTPSKKKRPNVIFIMADDMGYGDLGCINGGISHTPNMDRLHNASLRLSQAYSGSPVCAPSRACALTGRYPIRTGCVDLNDIYRLNRLAPDETTIADLFGRAGYRTGLVGKWHCGSDPESRPENRGFQEVEAFHPEGKDFWNWTIDDNGTEIPANGRYLTDDLNDRAVAFIERNHSQPFFLHLAHYAPHRPLQAPQDLIQKYLRNPQLTLGQAIVYSMIEVMDDGIGRVLHALEKFGILENTIVILTSDNGPDDLEIDGLSPARFNCGLRGQKYSVHEGGIRVPFLVHWPCGLEAGTFDGLFHFVDILPTLAAACSINLPGGLDLDGDNQLPCWQARVEFVLNPRFWQWNRYYPVEGCNAAIREGDWKLVLPAREGHRSLNAEHMALIRGELPKITIMPDWEGFARELGGVKPPLLFNIREDPRETRDLSHDCSRKVESMHLRLNTWFVHIRGQLDPIIASRF